MRARVYLLSGCLSCSLCSQRLLGERILNGPRGSQWQSRLQLEARSQEGKRVALIESPHFISIWIHVFARCSLLFALAARFAPLIWPKKRGARRAAQTSQWESAPGPHKPNNESQLKLISERAETALHFGERARELNKVARPLQFRHSCARWFLSSGRKRAKSIKRAGGRRLFARANLATRSIKWPTRTDIPLELHTSTRSRPPNEIAARRRALVEAAFGPSKVIRAARPPHLARDPSGRRSVAFVSSTQTKRNATDGIEPKRMVVLGARQKEGVSACRDSRAHVEDPPFK